MFTFAQVSDPHIGPLPDVRIRDLVSKRVFGYANWLRKRARAHLTDSLSTLLDDVRAHAPDHIVVTGDLVNIGLADEFRRARAWLDSIGSDRDVTVIPGNHDAYVPKAVGWFTDAWSHMMTGDEGAAAGSPFPFVRRRGPAAFVGVSTAIATAPLMATGRVGKAQASALADTLAALKRENLFRVILIHHPPTEKGGGWHRRLVDSDLVREAVGEAGAELVLHGHDHRTKISSIAGPDGPVPVVGAPAASEQPREGRQRGGYLLYRLDDADGRRSCVMTERAARSPDGPIETISEHRLVG
jgi:3',5'-cyclic AMP phosphodiesterase CpdA